MTIARTALLLVLAALGNVAVAASFDCD
jgi:hypothetical protein